MNYPCKDSNKQIDELSNLLNELTTVNAAELNTLEERIKLSIVQIYLRDLETVKSITHCLLEELLELAYSNIEKPRKAVALNICRMLYNGQTCKMLGLDSAKLAMLDDNELSEQLDINKQAFIVLRKSIIHDYKKLSDGPKINACNLVEVKSKLSKIILPEINTTLTKPLPRYNIAYREIVFQSRLPPAQQMILSLSNDIYLGILLIENKLKELNSNPKKNSDEINYLTNVLGDAEKTSSTINDEKKGLYYLRDKFQTTLRQATDPHPTLLNETHAILTNKVIAPLQQFYANQPGYKRLLNWAHNLVAKIFNRLYKIPFTRQINLTVSGVLEAAKDKISSNKLLIR